MAAVTPVLKKAGSDITDMSNYRPISNLPFLAKVLERVVVGQLHTHLCTYSLLERFQSGFRSGHSTETALVRVLNDLLVIADSGACGILVMLDLTAAFDTICHSILLDRLHKWTGLSGTVLDWFESYLSGRSQFVYLGSNRSQTVSLCQGVPQGSVLGPTLFSIYMLPLGKIIQKYGLSYHCYADDTQIYISSQPDLNFSSSNLSDCLMEIKGWMKLNFLKLNCSKTEVLLIGTPLNVSKCKDFRISVDNTQLSPSGQVRNLGVIFDAQLTFNSHFNNITKVAFFHLRNIARIRPFLSRPDAEKLIHAFITSRLDYCNSLFAGLPANSIKRLQYIQNSAARVLTHTSSRHHITPVLQQLHWLPVQSRIDFKVLILTYKAVHGLAPDYICDLVTPSIPARSLRSAGSLSLCQPRCKLKTMGGRAFSCNAPKLWNTLPASIRDAASVDCFKRLLKTHLFTQAFNL